MNRYLGLDVHATSCTLAVTTETGKRVGMEVVETNGAALVDAIKRIPGHKFLCMEEGTQSAWLYETLSPHVEKCVVKALGQERKVNRNKTDMDDAFALSDEIRTGSYGRAVHKELGVFRPLKLASKTYGYITVDVARSKNRAKALFRSYGVSTPADAVYDEDQRAIWLSKLPAHAQKPGAHLLREVALLEELKVQAQRDMLALAKPHAIYKVLQTCPGMGPIRVAQAMPVVVDPMRFRTRRQFWSYCGLGLKMHSSSDYVKREDKWARVNVNKTRGLSRQCNTTMKNIFKGAAMTVIGNVSQQDPLSMHYERMLENNIKPNLARLTLARQIASVFLKMWKTKEEYDPTKLTPKI